jgi:hypothetical protein
MVLAKPCVLRPQLDDRRGRSNRGRVPRCQQLTGRLLALIQTPSRLMSRSSSAVKRWFMAIGGEQLDVLSPFSPNTSEE